MANDSIGLLREVAKAGFTVKKNARGHNVVTGPDGRSVTVSNSSNTHAYANALSDLKKIGYIPGTKIGIEVPKPTDGLRGLLLDYLSQHSDTGFTDIILAERFKITLSQVDLVLRGAYKDFPNLQYLGKVGGYQAWEWLSKLPDSKITSTPSTPSSTPSTHEHRKLEGTFSKASRIYVLAELANGTTTSEKIAKSLGIGDDSVRRTLRLAKEKGLVGYKDDDTWVLLQRDIPRLPTTRIVWAYLFEQGDAVHLPDISKALGLTKNEINPACFRLCEAGFAERPRGGVYKVKATPSWADEAIDMLCLKRDFLTKGKRSDTRSEVKPEPKVTPKVTPSTVVTEPVGPTPVVPTIPVVPSEVPIPVPSVSQPTVRPIQVSPIISASPSGVLESFIAQRNTEVEVRDSAQKRISALDKLIEGYQELYPELKSQV